MTTFYIACADPERGCRGFEPPPLKNHKFIGLLSNTGPDPMKITKLPSQHSTLGYYRLACETPFKWRFAGRRIIAHFWWSLEPRSPKKTKINLIRVGPPRTIPCINSVFL